MSSFTNLKAKCVNELRRALNELEFSGDVATFSMLFIEEDKEPAREFRVAFLEASNKKLAVVFRDALALATGEKLENTPTAHLPSLSTQIRGRFRGLLLRHFCAGLRQFNYNVYRWRRHSALPMAMAMCTKTLVPI